MDPEKNHNISPDEHNAEQEALVEAKSDEVRQSIIQDLGLSENDNPDLVDKLVNREIEYRKKLSTAVRQKIDWRTKAQGAATEPKSKATSKSTEFDPEAIRQETAATVRQELEQRDLDEMPHPDNIKEEIKLLAKAKGVSVRVAEKDSYIQFKLEEHRKEERANEAASNGSPKGKTGIVVDTSKPLNAADFDFSTEEGRKAWQDAKKARRQQ